MKKPVVDAEASNEDAFRATPSNRTRAHALRKIARSGGMLSPADSDWLKEYDRHRTDTQESRGSSHSSRKVLHVETEEREASGEGEAAAEAAALGTYAREEGRRYDSLLNIALATMGRAVDIYERMATQMLDRNHQLERAHVQIIEAYRSNLLGRIETEAELAALERDKADGKDPLSKLADEMLPFILAKLSGTGTDAKPPEEPEKK